MWSGRSRKRVATSFYISGHYFFLILYLNILQVLCFSIHNIDHLCSAILFTCCPELDELHDPIYNAIHLSPFNMNLKRHVRTFLRSYFIFFIKFHYFKTKLFCCKSRAIMARGSGTASDWWLWVRFPLDVMDYFYPPLEWQRVVLSSLTKSRKHTISNSGEK